MSRTSNLSNPVADLELDVQERQGFDKEDRINAWKQKIGTELGNKVTFEVNLTKTQADIIETGRCEVWITSVDLVRPKPNNTTDPHPRAEAISSPSTPSIPPLVLPEIYSSQVACIYGTDGERKGMLTPERINILRIAFDRAKHMYACGIHDTIQPPPGVLVPDVTLTRYKLQASRVTRVTREKRPQSRRLTASLFCKHQWRTNGVELDRAGLPCNNTPRVANAHAT
eukprot:1141364-Pelagomonas_calceolata.AAC.1